MPSRSALRFPSYRRDKPTGQAVVTLNGKDLYLGAWNTRASRAEYDRLIGEWLAAGRCLPKPQSDLSIAELAFRYWRSADGYFRKDGQPTGSLDRIRVALRILRQSYAQTLAADFGPLALQAIQQQLAASGRSRRYCNYLIDTIRRVFKWGVAQQSVAESERKRSAARREHRQSPLTPSQARRRPKRDRRRPPGSHYTPHSYYYAVHRAVEVANKKIRDEAAAGGAEPRPLPAWHPNQLRHSAATEIRRHFGLEAVQAVLGHKNLIVSEVYAEKNLAVRRGEGPRPDFRRSEVGESDHGLCGRRRREVDGDYQRQRVPHLQRMCGCAD
jgi:hypothetical protein